MPKSRRDKSISLTQTEPKGRGLKQKLVDEVRDCLVQFKFVYLLRFENMRNTALKELRVAPLFRESRFFFARNSIMAIALGRTPEEAFHEQIDRLARRVRGQVALLFTNEAPKTVGRYFAEYKAPNFARSGFVATRDVDLEAGLLEGFPTSMEPSLRRLGLPTQIDNGKIIMRSNTKVCRAGEALSPEQAKILEHMEILMAVFRVRVMCSWSAGVYSEIESELDSADGTAAATAVDAANAEKAATAKGRATRRSRSKRR